MWWNYGSVWKYDPASHLVYAVEALARGKPYVSPTIAQTVIEHFTDVTEGKRGGARLTPREHEIVELIAAAKINKQIAHILDISIKTVETHRAGVLSKLKLRRKAELVLYAVRNNIVLA
jgi:DNA-binding NarL/FixJ family response regulator